MPDTPWRFPGHAPHSSAGGQAGRQGMVMGNQENDWDGYESPGAAIDHWKVKAQAYGTKLLILCNAFRRRGVEPKHVGIGQGWEEECERMLAAIEAEAIRRDI